MPVDQPVPLRDRTYALWASGFTRRWHMNPAMSHIEDFNCAHQGRCATLVIALWPDHSIELLRAAVTHDAAEVKAGDLYWDAKVRGGVLYDLHADHEAEVLQEMGFSQNLTDLDKARLHFVDRLDVFLFAELRQPAEVRRNGWPEARDWLASVSERLGCKDKVLRMLDASRKGDWS